MYIDGRADESSQREAGLNEKGYSERGEKRILDALGRGLLKEFPNPDRTGCPGSEVLKKIASHEMPLSEGEKWLDHLTSCSPCYKEFSEIRAGYRRRRTQTILAIAASILIVAGATSWALFLRQEGSVVTQTAVLDLRTRSIPRGGEQNPNEQPLEVSRAATNWSIYLPIGSSEGSYDLRILAPTGGVLVTTSGRANLKDQVTLLQTEMRLSSFPRGKYVLQIRRADSEWVSYSLMLR